MTAMSVLLSGCGAIDQSHVDPMAVAVQTCLARNKLFTDAWGCIQDLNALEKLGGDDGRRARFIRLGDDLATQVEAKTVSDNDARAQLLGGLIAEGSI